VKVSIDHSEVKKGFLKKKTYNQVAVTVQYTDYELAVIRKNKIEDHVILERTLDADRNDYDDMAKLGLLDRFHLRVKHFIGGKPNTYILNSPAESKVYEQEVTEALKNLKQFIENATEEPESTSFEL